MVDGPICDVARSSEGPSKQRRRRFGLAARILLVLLALLVIVEIHAKTAYEWTLSRLQENATLTRNTDDARLDRGEVENLISGFPTRQQKYRGQRRVDVLKWFSIFKVYVIQLRMADDGAVDSVISGEEDLAELSDEPRRMGEVLAARGHNLPLHTGTLGDRPRVVQVTYSGLNELRPGFVPPFPAVLLRELFRQALLLAAREELGWPTRDEKLGETFFKVNGAKWPAFDMVVRYRERRDGFHIEVHRWFNQSAGVLKTFEVELPMDAPFETVVAAAEQLARTEFVQFLKDHGHDGKPNPIQPAGDVPAAVSALLRQANFPAHLTAAREIHRLLRSEGESAERLSSLSFSYAMLAELSGHFSAMIPQAFQARALLYAERSSVRFPEEPAAFWGRARVRALVGRHAVGLQDLAHADELLRKLPSKSSKPRPDWVPVIDHFLHGRDAELRQTAVGTGDLSLNAALLNLHSAAVSQDREVVPDAAKLMLTVEPGQFRATEELGKHLELGPAAEFAESSLRETTLAFCANLKRVPGVSAEVLKIASEEADSVAVLVQQRVKLARALGQASEQDLMEPSLSALGGFLRECNFVQACRGYHYGRMLGVSVDDTLPTFAPLVADHPLKAYYDGQVWDQNRQLEIWFTLLNDNHWPALNFNGYPIMHVAMSSLFRERKTGGAGGNHKPDIDWFFAHLAPTFREQCWLRHNGRNQNERRQAARLLGAICPHARETVAAQLALDWPAIAARAGELEQNYQEDARMLVQLGRELRHSRRLDDAERCLNRASRLRNDRSTFEELAAVHLARNDEKLWLENLLRAAALPSEGLAEAWVYYTISEHYLSRGRPKDAFPYAQRASQTGSGWGLETLADCHEALGNWKDSEELRIAEAERYEQDLQWYLWCHRTGRGNVAAADKALGEWLEGESLGNPETHSIQFIRSILADDLPEALGHIEKVKELTRHSWRPYAVTHQILIFDQLDQEDRLPPLLDDAILAASHADLDGQSVEPLTWFMELRKYYLAGKERRVDLDRMDWIIRADALEGSRTNLLYFVGRILLNEGRTDEAIRYLQLASTSPIAHKYNAAVAGHTLRQVGQTVGLPRPTELESPEAALIELYDTARNWLQRGDGERARSWCDELLQRNPNWAPGQQLHARILAQLRDFRGAEEAMSKAIMLSPRLATLFVARGECLQALGQFAASARDYHQALEIDPYHSGAHFRLGMLLAAAPDDDVRNVQEARSHAEAIAVLNEQFGSFKNELLAAIAAETGDFKQAVIHSANAEYFRPHPEALKMRERTNQYRQGTKYRLPVTPDK